MLNDLNSLLVPALMQRLTLVVNHVLASETAAVERLKPHVGRSIALELTGWPRLLPPVPLLAFRITPAGLMEWSAEPLQKTADLLIKIDASNPALLAAKAMLGDRPPAEIQGDSQLAGDVDWLLQNLRWDVSADLQRLFGPVVAQQLHSLGSALARALRAALSGTTSLAEKARAASGSGDSTASR